jgi:hypothetical protein
MSQMAVIVAAAAVFMNLERVRPGRAVPNPSGWSAHAALLEAMQRAAVVLGRMLLFRIVP